jgi:5'(3')-deoxyribonucleotidase
MPFKTFFIDIDGVLANFPLEFSKIVKRVVGKDIPASPKELQTWNWNNLLTEKELDRVWEEIRKTENFWLKLRPLLNEYQREEFIKVLQAMAKEVEPVFITSRFDTKGLSAYDQTINWLEKWFPFNKMDTPMLLVFSSQDAKVKFIAFYANQAPFAVLEDNPEVIGPLAKLNREKAIFGMDYPYTRTVKDDSIIWVSSAVEAAYQLHSLVFSKRK